MKYTVKLLLWAADPNPQGLLPIYVRVTVNRDRKYISTGIFVPENQWDARSEQLKDSHPLHHLHNPDLADRKAKIMRWIAERQLKGDIITAGAVKAMFTRGEDLHNVFLFIDAYIQECKGKKSPATLENYRKHALRLELFHGSRALTFEEITSEYLGRYERHLRQGTKDAKPVGSNYISALWSTLRAFFNAARKRRIISCYPFDQYENPVYEGPVKEYLTTQELRVWEAYADKIIHPILRQAAVYFLFGCYTGLRVSDWHRFDHKEHITGDRMRIRAKKNGEWVMMPVSAPLARNLTRMQAVPFDTDEQVINRRLEDICKTLGIRKKLTTHGGRHTFAITICAERGISAETCAELMGITIKTCVENYYRVTQRKIEAETLKAWEGL
jgi:site-specific recombinase XerD